MLYYHSKDVFDAESEIRVQRIRDVKIIEHKHEFIELIYIESGSAYHRINNIEYEVKKGDILFVNYGETHSFSSESGFTFYNILLTPGFLSEELANSENILDLLSLNSFESFPNLKPEPKITFDANEIVFIEHMIFEMEREYKERKSGYVQALRSYVTVLLINVFRKIDSGNILGSQKKISAEILNYLDNNYNEKITIQELAKRCFYTPSYFSRMFKEIYGMTLTDYILKKRFEKACNLLESTNMSIEEIAIESGYKDGSAIFSQFKKYLGLTPGEYRAKVKNKNNEGNDLV